MRLFFKIVLPVFCIFALLIFLVLQLGEHNLDKSLIGSIKTSSLNLAPALIDTTREMPASIQSGCVHRLDFAYEGCVFTSTAGNGIQITNKNLETGTVIVIEVTDQGEKWSHTTETSSKVSAININAGP